MARLVDADRVGDAGEDLDQVAGVDIEEMSFAGVEGFDSDRDVSRDQVERLLLALMDVVPPIHARLQLEVGQESDGIRVVVEDLEGALRQLDTLPLQGGRCWPGFNHRDRVVKDPTPTVAANSRGFATWGGVLHQKSVLASFRSSSLIQMFR